MQKKSYHVIIVGGGIIAKICALLLSKNGLRVAQITNRKTSIDRVYAISNQASALLNKIGVWQDLVATQGLQTLSAQAVLEMEIFSASAEKHSTHINKDDTLIQNYYKAQLNFSAYSSSLSQLAWIITNNRLENILDNALKFSHTLDIIYDNTKASWRNVDNVPYICLQLDSGEVLNSECLIGADGANSWVRTQAGIQIKEKNYRQTAITAQFSVTKSHNWIARQWFLPETEILALLPLANGQVSIVWSATNEHAQKILAMDSQEFSNYLETIGTVKEYTGNIFLESKISSYPLKFILAKSLIAPSTLLLGDAAHVPHPLAGQGLNLGLRDIETLGNIFAAKKNFRSYGDHNLLKSYATARALDIATTMYGIDLLYRSFALSGNISDKAKNLSLKILNSSSLIKNFFIKKIAN